MAAPPFEPPPAGAKRSIRIVGWSLVAAFALSGTAASAAGRDEGLGRRHCTDIRGYLDDPRPGGREVRAAPDPAAPVIGTIREPWTDGQAIVAASFDIEGSQDGWLLVDGAGDDAVLTGGVERAMYGGQGWIIGQGVSVGVQASQGFAGPNHSSDIVIRTRPNELDFLAGVAACDGNWVLGRWNADENAEYRQYRYDPSAVVSTDPLVLQAWVTGICNIQETSCDMAPGDRPED